MGIVEWCVCLYTNVSGGGIGFRLAGVSIFLFCRAGWRVKKPERERASVHVLFYALLVFAFSMDRFRRLSW